MRKLAIIGGNYLQEPLVRKAKEMGIETHCFAWEEGAVCKEIADYFYPISIIDKELILEKCKEIGVDGITSIASDAAVPTVCFVAEEMGLLGNPYRDALITTNKYNMRKRFAYYEVKSPRFVLAKDNYKLIDFKFPVIVKPTDRSGSRGVKKVIYPEDISKAVTRAKAESFSDEAIIEEYVDGTEVSVESISWEGKHYIITITDKVTSGEPYFVELQHHQPTLLSIEIQHKIREETHKSLNALGIKYGASHSEFKITENGDVYVIEVGARMGGDFIGSDLVQLSTGYDFVKGVIEISLGNFEEPILTDNRSSGVYFLSKETVYIKPYIEHPELHPEIVKSEITSTKLCSAQSSNQRSGYFIYRSDKRMVL